MAQRDNDFLIYGGIVVPEGRAVELSRAVDQIRARAGVPRDFQLKFNPGPDGMLHREFIELKQSLIEAMIECQVGLIVYVVLHNIARDADLARRNGINQVCFNFDILLRRYRAPGLVLIDRFNDEGNQIDGHLREKFSIGVTGLPHADEVRLANIVGFHYSAIGQSHFPSLVDIALGSLRFSLNAHCRNEDGNLETARRLLCLLEPMFYRDGAGPISELSLLFSPKVISHAPYRQRYEALKEFLVNAGLDTAQEIRADRRGEEAG